MATLGYRGRLIHPLKVRIARLDRAAIRASGRYDDATRSPGVDVSTGVRRPNRLVVGEGEVVELDAQVEDGLDALQQRLAGNDQEVRMTMVFHFLHLEALGLVDARSGEALCPREGDRLVGVYQQDGSPAYVPDPRHTLVTCVGAPQHGGLGGGRNLLIAQFERRRTASQT
jgi:hypothetical protein